MHMSKYFTNASGLVKATAVLLVVAAALLFRPAAAQAQVVQSHTVGAIRLGAFIPINSATRSTYGNYLFNAGLDYNFQHTGLNTRNLISVDYTEMSKDGKNIRLIPVTIGQQTVSNTDQKGVHPFAGYGVGIYFVHLKNPNDTNFGGSNTYNTQTFGGYLVAGLDLTSTLFVDARYNIVTPAKGVNTDGFIVSAGLRF